MLRIYLCRHGQNVDNANGILNGRRDEPLTDKGIEQAKEIAEKIFGLGLSFDAIFSSPLVRASRTAEIIAERLGGPAPVILKDLIERDFGVMTGVEQSRIAELCAPDIIKTDIITYFLEPAGAETFPDLMIRAARLLKEVRSRFSEGDVLLVTHGDVGKMIYAQYYGLDWRRVLTDFHFGNAELLLMSEGSPAEETHVFRIEQHNH